MIPVERRDGLEQAVVQDLPRLGDGVNVRFAVRQEVARSNLRSEARRLRTDGPSRSEDDQLRVELFELSGNVVLELHATGAPGHRSSHERRTSIMREDGRR